MGVGGSDPATNELDPSDSHNAGASGLTEGRALARAPPRLASAGESGAGLGVEEMLVVGDAPVRADDDVLARAVGGVDVAVDVRVGAEGLDDVDRDHASCLAGEAEVLWTEAHHDVAVADLVRRGALRLSARWSAATRSCRQ